MFPCLLLLYSLIHIHCNAGVVYLISIRLVCRWCWMLVAYHRSIDQINIETVIHRCNSINSLRPRLNRRPLADDIFKCIFFNENVWISIKIALKFVPKGLINNIPALVQIMAWRRPGDKPLYEPMMVSLLTHICVTRPQWVIISVHCEENYAPMVLPSHRPDRICGSKHAPMSNTTRAFPSPPTTHLTKVLQSVRSKSRCLVRGICLKQTVILCFPTFPIWFSCFHF